MDQVKAGSQAITIELEWREDDGSPMDTITDVTALTYETSVRYQDGTSTTASWTATSPEKGKLEYTTQSGDLTKAGTFSIIPKMTRSSAGLPIVYGNPEHPYVFKVVD